MILTLLIFVPILYGVLEFTPILEHRLHIILIIALVIGAISFVDDMDTIGRSPLRVPPVFRLVMQIGVGILIGLTSIKISYVSNIFGGIIDLTAYHFDFMLA